MIFRLLEAPNSESSSPLDIMMDKNASMEDRLDACIQYAKENNCTRLLDVLQKKDDKANKLFDTLLLIFNYEQDVISKFYFMLPRVQISAIEPQYYSNFVTLCDVLSEVPDFGYKKPYLSDPSLYNREARDFNYTLKVMDIVYNPSKLVNYYDPKKINIKDLYNTNKIKPTGITRKDPDDFGTIYGVLESWKETAANENTTDKKEKNDPENVDEKSDNGNSNNNGKNNSSKTYASVEAAKKAIRKPAHGDRIRVDGDYEYDSKKQDWVPVKK